MHDLFFMNFMVYTNPLMVFMIVSPTQLMVSDGKDDQSLSKSPGAWGTRNRATSKSCYPFKQISTNQTYKKAKHFKTSNANMPNKYTYH